MQRLRITPRRLGEFDPDELRAKFNVHTLEVDGGLAAVVTVGRSPVHAYNSANERGEHGIFPNDASAIRHGQRWVEAQVSRRFRIEQLRIERATALPEILSARMLERSEEKEKAKAANARVKTIDQECARLVEEARDPQVQLEFAISSDDFVLFDAPSFTDGTETEDGGRQVSLDLDAPEDDGDRRSPSAPEASPKLPPKRKGKASEEPEAPPATKPAGMAPQWKPRPVNVTEGTNGWVINGVVVAKLEGAMLDRFRGQTLPDGPKRTEGQDDDAYRAALVEYAQGLQHDKDDDA